MIVGAPLEVVWVVFAAGYITLQRRSAPSTLAWILLLSFLPLVGVAFYLLLGPRRYDRRTKRRASAVRAVGRSLATTDDENVASEAPTQLARMLERTVGPAARVRPGRVRLFFDGRSLFEALEASVAAATHHVHLEYYIWEPDRLGTRLRDLLVERARAGVQVRVLVDAIGSSSARTSFWRPLREAGGQVRAFNESTLRRWRPRMMNFRTHRKIAIVDGVVGYTGGMNVTEVHTSEFAGEEAWRDTHVELRGAVVRGLSLVFFEDWSYAAGESPALSDYLSRVDAVGTTGDAEEALQIVSSGPDESLDAIHKLFFTAISGARHRVQLTTPYFVPDETIVAALGVAALGGVEVSLLLPRGGDQPIVSAAARTYYPELLDAGVHIHELAAPVLHAKTLVVDDVAIVGTANTDNRSFRLNFEVVAVCHGGGSADRLAAQFARDLEHAQAIHFEDLVAAGLHRRLLGSVARLFSPLL